ncbi:MAG: ubiquinone/menaquinone biosynthesis methyltransferase [Pseudomonas sp.]
MHLPHAPLPAYYPSNDAAARAAFLRETFDAAAVDYDRLEKILGLGSGSRYRRQALLRAGLRPGMQVVDVGMGTGLVSQEILKITGEPQRLVGVDPSPGMMQQAHFAQPVECRIGRAEEIPVPSASADFVVMGYALRHIADFAAAAAEFRRVLKPGGRLLVLEFSKPTNALMSKAYDAYSFAFMPLMGKLITNDAESYRYLAESIRMHPDQETLKSMMVEAGFDRVTYHNMTSGIVALHRGIKP